MQNYAPNTRTGDTLPTLETLVQGLGVLKAILEQFVLCPHKMRHTHSTLHVHKQEQDIDSLYSDFSEYISYNQL